jgi:hypothetical protein
MTETQSDLRSGETQIKGKVYNTVLYMMQELSDVVCPEEGADGAMCSADDDAERLCRWRDTGQILDARGRQST